MTYNERRLEQWILQTIRNMQALGYGHQSGEPYIMLGDAGAGGVILTQSHLPCFSRTLEEWVALNVLTHGHKIIGAGYTYGNQVPSGIREDVIRDHAQPTSATSVREPV